eukprot:scaffold61036_cov47-Phaeocystis_antarctica.AAC.1
MRPKPENRTPATTSSPGSAVAIAMMVGGGRTPPFAALLGPDWRYAPGDEHRLVRLGATFPVAGRTPCLS